MSQMESSHITAVAEWAMLSGSFAHMVIQLDRQVALLPDRLRSCAHTIRCARRLHRVVPGRVPEHLRNAVEGHLSNFNISVGVTDEFMEALFADEEFTFTNPRTEDPHIATPETKELYELHDLGEHVEVGEELSVPAEELWDHIVSGAHENGEPGVIYLERVNKEHSFDVEKHSEHEILATNPCGEQPLEEYEACNLGHINLSTLADKDAPDWRVWYDNNGDAYNNLDDAAEAFIYEAIDMNAFNRRIESGTRFLENVVTMSDFPVDEIDDRSKISIIQQQNLSSGMRLTSALPLMEEQRRRLRFMIMDLLMSGRFRQRADSILLQRLITASGHSLVMARTHGRKQVSSNLAIVSFFNAIRLTLALVSRLRRMSGQMMHRTPPRVLSCREG